MKDPECNNIQFDTNSQFTKVLSVTEQLEMLLRLRIICERLNFAKAFLGNIDIIILNKKIEASIDEKEFKQLYEQVKSDMSMYDVKDTRVDYIMDENGKLNPIWTSIGDILINRFNDLERDTVKNGPISRKIEVINHYLTYVEKDDLDPLYELLQLLQFLEECIDNYITCLNNDFYELIQKRHEFNMDIKTFSHNIIAINDGKENQESTWINAMLQLFDTPVYNKNTALLIEDVGSSIKDSFETDDLELVDIIKISRTIEKVLKHYNSLNYSIISNQTLTGEKVR